MNDKNFSFIIVAGGKGSRMGGLSKQFVLLNNKPVWKWSADKAAELCDAGIREILLVIPKDSDEKITWENQNVPLRVIHGGNERAESVLNGLREATCEFVMIHDAARPFAGKDLFISLMNNTTEFTGAIPLLPVSDALKKVDDKNISCVERDGLYITQTPQSFHRERLIAAVSQNLKAKDEAEAWVNYSPENKLIKIEGERLNFKLTWQEDLLMAKSLCAQRITRTGIGYDIHQLIPGRKLILGGVLIKDSPLGLLGHSDADLLAHAVMDAILGAAGLEDIGNLFPASNERYKNADSIKLLEKVIALVNSEGWQIDFVDVVLEAQVPRLNKYRTLIKDSLARYFLVNVKFKSAEMIDDAGKGLAMKCWAVANLSR